MTMHFRDLAERAAADGVISTDEILSLRRESWGDGSIALDEAEAIFTLNDRIAEATTEWNDFFVEALSEFIVNGHEPRGYVDEGNAGWLIARVDADGRVDSMAELELLVKVLEKAANVPETLKSYALGQIERAVLVGTGPTRDGGALEPGCITSAECRLLRRMIFAQGGDRPAAVSQQEAELLFRLKDATIDASNAPEWKQLFVQGTANYLAGYSSVHAQLSLERAGELEAFMNDGSSGVGRFFARMARSGLGGFRQVPPSHEQADHQAQVAAANAVTAVERAWLQSRIDDDGQLDEYEEALLAFLAEC